MICLTTWRNLSESNAINIDNKFKKITWNKDKTKLIIDFSNYFSLQGGVTPSFNYFCAKNYKSYEPIINIEYKRQELCENSAHQFLDDKCKNTIIYDCNGYDFNKFYLRLMGSDFMIPINQGKQYKYKFLDLTKKICYGFYRCTITENKNY